MRDGPSGSVLLAIARTRLLGEILPRLPPDLVYTARMIANAMAIAGRELEADGAAIERDGARRIRDVYREAGLPEPPSELDTEAMERRLAADIRAGRFDAASRALTALLEWQVRQRLLLANPKFSLQHIEQG